MSILKHPLTPSKKEFGEIIKINKEADLPHSSICRKLPLNLVYNTIDELELGMGNLYSMQTSLKIEILHEFLSRSGMIGSLLLLSIEWSTMHVGIVRNMFSVDYDLYSNLLPRSWIKNIWNFAHEYRTSLPTSPTQLDLHREGDLFLMEQFTRSGFTPIQLKKLNRCQLYFQIPTLSNISNGHGTYFGKRYYDGH